MMKWDQTLETGMENRTKDGYGHFPGKMAPRGGIFFNL